MACNLDSERSPGLASKENSISFFRGRMLWMAVQSLAICASFRVVGVPPPTNTVSTGAIGPFAAVNSISLISKSTYSSTGCPSKNTLLKSQ